MNFQETVTRELAQADDLLSVVLLALGAASMCWNPKPGNMVFDDQAANMIADVLLAEIYKRT
ncbi:MAG: hypothetical protein ACREOZ_02120 [Gloeomargaritales cyanobacterium]